MNGDGDFDGRMGHLPDKRTEIGEIGTPPFVAMQRKKIISGWRAKNQCVWTSLQFPTHSSPRPRTVGTIGTDCNLHHAALWCCLPITLRRSKVPLTKTVTLMVRVNEPLVKRCYNHHNRSQHWSRVFTCVYLNKFIFTQNTYIIYFNTKL